MDGLIWRTVKRCITGDCVEAAAWPSIFRKSSYSGLDCVEVGAPVGGAFIKSSASNPKGDCVEALAVPQYVLIRDTKDRERLMLRFDTAIWVAFLAEVRLGEYETLGLPRNVNTTPTDNCVVMVARPSKNTVVVWCGFCPNDRLAFTDAEWDAFLAGCANGEFEPKALMRPVAV